MYFSQVVCFVAVVIVTTYQLNKKDDSHLIDFLVVGKLLFFPFDLFFLPLKRLTELKPEGSIQIRHMTKIVLKPQHLSWFENKT